MCNSYCHATLHTIFAVSTVKKTWDQSLVRYCHCIKISREKKKNKTCNSLIKGDEIKIP